MWGLVLQGSWLLSRSLVVLGSGCTLHPHLHQKRKDQVVHSLGLHRPPASRWTSTPPRSVTPTAPTPHSGDAQQVPWTPWVLPVLHPFGLPLSKTALCSISAPRGDTWPGLANQGFTLLAAVTGLGVGGRPNRTQRDSLPQCFPPSPPQGC